MAPRANPIGKRKKRADAIIDEERDEIVLATLYLAPRYCWKKTGKWQVKSPAKFVEVKRLLGTERTANGLRHIFARWLAKNGEKWEEMKQEALADWEGYFAVWIEHEKELDRSGLPPAEPNAENTPEEEALDGDGVGSRALRIGNVTEDERLSIASAALYLAPRYTTKAGRWKLMSPAKFAAVKRLTCSERSVATLANTFTRWLKANEAKWEEMKADAAADWDGYFADWIVLDKEEDDVAQTPPINDSSGEGEKMPVAEQTGHTMAVTGEEEYDLEIDTSDFVPQPRRVNERRAQRTLYRSVSVVHGPMNIFNAPVNVNFLRPNALRQN